MSGPLHWGLPRLKHDPQVGLHPRRPRFLESCRPRSRYGGAREVTLCLWISLYEEVVHGWGCSRPGEGETAEMLPPVYMPPGTCRRPSQRRRRTAQKAQAGHPSGRLCPSLSCRTESTISASLLPPALPRTAQWHGRSPWWRGELNQQFSSALRYHSNWFAHPHLALSAGWYACSTDIVWRHAPAWPAAVDPLPTSADDTRSGLVGKTGAFRDDAAPGDR